MGSWNFLPVLCCREEGECQASEVESLSCRQCLWERLRSINQCSLVCAQIQICCSRKPGISAVIFIPVVFLPKHRSGDCGWVEKSDLNFLVVPRLQVLAFMKNEFLMCNRFHTHYYFESPFMLYYIPRYSTECCAFLLLLSFSLTWTLFLITC